MTRSTSLKASSVQKNSGGILFPKPKTRKQQRDKRRREIKRKDREFQADMPPDARCLVANAHCRGSLTKHHRVTRARIATRWTDAITWILCYFHHEEIERIEEKRFCEKYNLTPIPLPNHTV